VSEFDKKDWLR
jgi:hypothetical protein